MLSLLIELQRLKRVDRTGWTLRGMTAGTETVAAHSFGVVATVMLLADNIAARGVAIDVERVLRLAVVHDWAEARTGDVPRAALAYFGADARKRVERAVFDDMTATLDESLRGRLRVWHEDYEERASLEARLVKAADVIDLLVQVLAFEQAGVRGLDEFWENATGQDFKLEGDPRAVIDETLRAIVERREAILKR